MTQDLRKLLEIPHARLDEINALLLNPDEQVINDFLAVVEKYGTPEEINAKAKEARKLDNLLAKVKEVKPEYLEDLKLGDLVYLEDILTAWGRGYYSGAATIGVVSCGASNSMGQGIGVTVLLTSKDGELQPKIDPGANLTKYLNLEGSA